MGLRAAPPGSPHGNLLKKNGNMAGTPGRIPMETCEAQRIL